MHAERYFSAIVIISFQDKLPSGQFHQKEKWIFDVWNWFKLILNEIQLYCFVWDLCGKLKPYLCSTSHTFPKAKKRQNLNKRNAKRKKSTLAIIIIIISINICFNCFPISRRNTMVQSYYTWQNINLLSMHHQGKYDVWSYWGFQHFTQLCNLLAKDSSHMIQHCHQDICKTKQAQDCQKKLILWIQL